MLIPPKEPCAWSKNGALSASLCTELGVEEEEDRREEEDVVSIFWLELVAAEGDRVSPERSLPFRRLSGVVFCSCASASVHMTD